MIGRTARLRPARSAPARRRGCSRRRGGSNRKALAEIWRLGAPIGFSIAVEIGVFAAAALAMGLIGTGGGRGPCDRHADRRDGLHGSARPWSGRERRVGHAFGARDARAGVDARAGRRSQSRLSFVILSAAVMFVFPRQLIAPFLGGDAADAGRRRRAGAVVPEGRGLFQIVRRRAGGAHQHAARRARFARPRAAGDSGLLGDRRADRLRPRLPDAA